MSRAFLAAVIAAGSFACSSSQPTSNGSNPSPVENAGPILLASQKAAKSVAWYSLDSGKLLAEVPVSDHPHEIVLSPDGRRLYVTDNGVMRIEDAGEGGHKVSIIDVPNRSKVAEIDLGRWHRPHGIDLCADGTLLVTSENPDQLLVIDLAANQILSHYETGGETPHIVKCSRDSTAAYVSNARSGTVARIELTSGERRLVETGARPEGSILSADGKTLYVAHRDADKIVLVDTAAWTVAAEIPTGGSPVRCGLTADEKTVVYGLVGDQAVGFADIATRTETGQVPLAGPAVSLEMHSDGSTALACAQDVGECYVISIPEQKILHTVTVAEGAGPDPALLL